ncbi:MAG: hypothetical protein ACI4KF_08030 [Huintestinicola sp.]
MALDMEYLKRIDRLAYNRPEVIPDELMRGDKIQYKIYFRFMCAVYMMYRKNFMNDDELKTIKAEFIKDFERFDVLSKAAIKTARNSGRLALAAAECRKNTSCICCRTVAEIYGAPSRADDEDINAEGQVN